MNDLYNMKEVIKLLEKHVYERQVDRHQGLNVLLDFLVDMFDVRHFYKENGFQANCLELSEKEPYLYKIAIIWMNKVTDALENGTWIDFFGGIYEEMYQSKGKASALGQFFTPPAICDMMSIVAGRNVTGRVNDCACGSGRTLLSAFANSGYPKDVYYMGDDIDTASVKMCALNMMIHGMRGRVVRHDTLKEPIAFDYGFELNEVRYPIPTMYYSLRRISHTRESIVDKNIPMVEDRKIETKIEKKTKKPETGQLSLFGDLF